MSEQEKSEQAAAIAELVADAEITQSEVAQSEAAHGGLESGAAVQPADASNKVFGKFKIKDIVFLAIITACTLVTGAVMPFVSGVPLFGIIQLCLGLQFSLFPVIGMFKVRKPGALLLQAVFISVFLVFMFPPMVCIIVCALVAEAFVLVIFRGYKNDWACVLAGTLYMPLTIPMLFAVYAAAPSVGKGKAAEAMFIAGNVNAGVIIGITIAVVAVCFIGSSVGMLIARELKKSGKLK